MGMSVRSRAPAFLDLDQVAGGTSRLNLGDGSMPRLPRLEGPATLSPGFRQLPASVPIFYGRLTLPAMLRHVIGTFAGCPTVTSARSCPAFLPPAVAK
jgi:hypothetical protein